MLLLTALIGLAAAILLLPLLSDGASLLRTPVPRSPRRARGAALPRLLVLMPAHDEELLIGRTLAALRGVRYPRSRLEVVVVADNCTDDTARIARRAGVRCLVRHDPALRGKPHAIAWALERLPLREFDAVVVVDADSVVDAGFARALARRPGLREGVLQPYNDVENRQETALTRMAYVFSAVRFRYMNEVKRRAGLNVPLGNGLCIGTEVLQAHGWSAFSICEDWELYAILTARGVRIQSVPEARICSQEARSLRQSSSQRRRWTAGRIMVLLQQAPALLRSRAVGAHQKLDVLAELTGQGPAVHLGLVVLMSGAAQLLAPPGAAVLQLALGLSLVRLAAYTALAIRHDPEPLRAALAFAFLPPYTLWRLGVQVSSLGMLGNKPWIRTERHLDAGVEAPAR